jgi:simple sugar transport system ATP-binding protein
VWRNLCLGAEPTRGRWPLRRLDVDAARETAVRAFERIGVTGIDPDQPVNSLQAGARQSLAIARAVHHGARALVLDEPTEPMTIAQHTLVGQAVLGARARGLAVVLVTHNPRYAHLVGDRFLLLARGQVAGDLTHADVDADDLTRLMAGGEELTALTTRLQELHPELGER